MPDLIGKKDGRPPSATHQAETQAGPELVLAELEQSEAIEKRIWKAADTLRANSAYAGNKYFLPVILIPLGYVYSRILNVKAAIATDLPRPGGKTRALRTENFSQKTALYFKPEAQFEYLVFLPDSEDLATEITQAMESTENNYPETRRRSESDQFSDILRNVMRHVKTLREQKEELVLAREVLLLSLLRGEVAA